MNNIVKEFIDKLNEKYINTNGKIKNEYNEFLNKKKSITKENLNMLLNKYPDLPKSLIDLLENFDGSEYLYCFNSDVDNGTYPYYLISSQEMIEHENYFDCLNEMIIDDKIDKNNNKNKWMLFSNCMNNGGTSSLWIDFTPSSKGKVGQVIRYLHDEESIIVISNSFDEYLRQVIDSNFIFVDECVKLENQFNNEKENNINVKKRKRNDYVKKHIAIILVSSLIILFIILFMLIGFIVF